MRLIDADLLVERIKRNDDLPWNLDPIMVIAFSSCVNHSPTAYDVDKVVEELRHCSIWKFRGQLPDGRICHFSDIIDLVKKDGIK